MTNEMAEDLSDYSPEAPSQIASQAGPADSESAGTVLDNLRAAGLVSHVARDPAATGGETAALKALCAQVAGSVYRLAPFHYAFSLQSGDAASECGEEAPQAWAGILEAALRRGSGASGFEVRALAPSAAVQEAAGSIDAPVLMLRAWDAAVTAGIESAGPAVQAVINAHFAAETARLTAQRVAEGMPPAADGQDGSLAVSALERRLEAIETQIARVAAGLEARTSQELEALAQTRDMLADLVLRLDTGNAEFRRSLGCALAEFLTQIDGRAAIPPHTADPRQAG